MKNNSLYYIGLVSFVLFFIKKELGWDYPNEIFRIISFLSLTVNLVLSINRFKGSEILILVFFLLVVIVTGILSEYISLLYLTYALVVGAKGLDFRSIMKVWLGLAFAISFISIAGSSVGIIEDKIYHKPVDSLESMGLSSSISHCAGYLWTTGCAIHISMICLIYWIMKKGKMRLADYLVLICAFWFTYDYNKARQASAVILLIILASFYVWYYQSLHKDPNRFLLGLFLVCIPLFAGLSLYATIAYDKTDLFWVGANILLSSRLALGNEGIEKYGISWFGQPVEMVGADVRIEDYNYIDSSYVQAYVLWGIVLSTFLIAAYQIISYRAYKKRDFVMLFSVFVVGLSSITSQYLFQIYYCPLLVALFSNYGISTKTYVKKRKFKKADS